MTLKSENRQLDEIENTEENSNSQNTIVPQLEHVETADDNGKRDSITVTSGKELPHAPVTKKPQQREDKIYVTMESAYKMLK
ncbi:hypothetical protein JTB14_013955 [Gonioctena quinquepunctata]|nr:hypothetical protein JTB14_013955 [Gonioctena quinquepunctata]